MKNKLNIFLILLFVAVFISVFYRWFFQGEIIGGDWPYLFKESLNNYYFLVPSWNTWQGNGLGGTHPIYFLQSFEYLTVFLANFFHISWPIIYKIFWFGLFIVLSILSSIYLLKTICSSAKLWQMGLSALVFTTNTYILMVVGGGQMGIALAYSVAPLVLARFIIVINNLNFSSLNLKSQKKLEIGNWKLEILRKSGVAGLLLSLQALFDPRIAYVSMIAVVIYVTLSVKKNIPNTLYLILYTFVVPGLITVLLNIFWILPLFSFSQDLYQRFGDSDTGIGMVKFLSFSTFSQSLSLLHPNWPENIFGKVGFMKSEFLILPIIAYSSLLFKFQRKILFLAFIGLLGAFLVKGANPPFGDLFLWIFENIPGFAMFRDPTKFYILTAMSYSVLIPFSIYSIYGWLNSKLKSQNSKQQLKIHNFLPNLFLLFTICYLLLLIQPAILGQLEGTFKKHEVPKEYVMLKDFLHKQPDFFRTLWVPRQHRFTFFSKVHPSIEIGSLFNATSAGDAIKELEKTGAKEYLSELSVKYLIVPYDSLGEFFLTDRKYDKTIPETISESLESIAWLKKIDGFGSITILEVPSPKDHFSLEKSGKISYKMLSPTSYFISVSLVNPQKLIFSEKYNPSWIAKIKNKTVKSEKTLNNLNSFDLEKGDYDLEIIFLQDKVYSFGRAISLITFLGVLFFIFKYRKFNVLPN